MIRSRAEYGCRQFRLEFHTRSGEPGNALDLTYRLRIHFQPGFGDEGEAQSKMQAFRNERNGLCL